MKTRTIARRGLLVASLALLAALVLAACGGSGGGYGGGSGATTPASSPSSSPVGGETDSISIENYSFTPAETTVGAGTTITWTNNDSTAHDVTSTDGPGIDAAPTSDFASETMAQGDTFSFTFDKPGSYYYECTIHAGMATMHGVVIVE